MELKYINGKLTLKDQIEQNKTEIMRIYKNLPKIYARLKKLEGQ